MILVAGATGQLGTAVVRRLVASQKPVRAFVRPTSGYQHLQGKGVELAFGDLRDVDSIDAACRDVEAVIATANSIVPRRGDTFEGTEGDGYHNLINACLRHGVRQFVFMSVPVTPNDHRIPTFRTKRLIEHRVRQSNIPYTFFRGSLFMDVYLATLGSFIPLRGAEAATLRRPFWFSRMFMGGVGRLIENRGVALVPGNGKTRHAFVAIDDVAALMVKSIGHLDAQNAIFDIGGPEILSWDDVVRIYGKVLGRPVRAVHQPAGVFRFQQLVLTPFSPAAANLMGAIWLVGTLDTPYVMKEVTRTFGVSLTSVEQFLRQKLSLPAN